MLVLSRHPEEKIVFPSLGVTIQVLRIQGNAVRIGVEAPPDVRVLRHELMAPGAVANVCRLANESAHALANQLNKVVLSLNLAQRQIQVGQVEAAEASLAGALAKLGEIDQATLAGRTADRPVPPRVAARCRTLVVEDNTNERELLAGLLSMHGCECATAADGLDALDYLAAHERPDFVLLDMAMPRCDGPHTLERIRRDPRLGGLKVFAISGSPPDELDVGTGPGGFDAFFPKPLDPQHLWAAMQRHLN